MAIPSMSPIRGRFEQDTFICEGSGQRINNCKRGLLALTEHFLQQNVCLDVQIIPSGERSRIYVPLHEIKRQYPHMEPGPIGRLFAASLHANVEQATQQQTATQQVLDQFKANLAKDPSTPIPQAYAGVKAFTDAQGAAQKK